MTAHLPPQRSETVFEDFKLPLLHDAAVAEANRCLFCHDAPCINACPTHIDIPQFIRKIATENVHGSAKTIFESNILGMSCARVCPVEVLCVGACVYNDLHQPPIAIGKLQRYATDEAYAQGWRFFEAGAPTGKRVALIGAGPASLAAAHELRRLGHACTILERRANIGGLNANGVAPYKMKADRALSEAEWVLSIGGIEVRTGVNVGTDVTLESLEKEFDAVFVGSGLGADSVLGVPGEGLPGVSGAVAWIEAMKLGTVDVSKVRRAVVVGGGNTAIDAAREARGLGIPHVTMLYRGLQDSMSGYAHEWKAALVDGVEAEWQAVATAIEGDGRVQCVRRRVEEARARERIHGGGGAGAPGDRPVEARRDGDRAPRHPRGARLPAGGRARIHRPATLVRGRRLHERWPGSGERRRRGQGRGARHPRGTDRRHQDGEQSTCLT
jgi:glutamate synthase (NADPH/NADH) small chain